ncbi:MAG: HU family DNA-binding protein [Rhodothermales bacterium]
MPTPPRDQIESVLADIVRESLTASESVAVPGLGTFAVEHKTSSRVRSEQGELTFIPPRDEIVFTPEQQDFATDDR